MAAPAAGQGPAAVGICASWATRDQAVDQLIADLLVLAR